MAEAASLETIDLVVERLRLDVRARARRKRWLLVGAFGLLLLTVIASLIAPEAIAEATLWAAIFVGGGLLGGGSLLQNLRSAHGITDKRLVGPLLEATVIGEPEIESEALDALRPLLKRLDAGDELTDREQKLLAKVLCSSRDAETVEGAIHALRAMNVYSAVPDLEMVANRQAAIKGEAAARAQNLALLALADLRMNRAGEIIHERAPTESLEETRLRLRIGDAD